MTRRSSRPCCATSARSGSPARSRRPSCASARTEPFTTSARLVDLLKRVVPAASQKSGGHPGKRTFQALRIEVNAELSVWAAGAAPRPRRAGRRRPRGGAVLPLARGPHHQAGARRGRPQQRPAGPAGRAARARGIPAAAHARRRGGPGRGAGRPTPAPPRSACARPSAPEPLRPEPPRTTKGTTAMSQPTATARVAARAPQRRQTRARSRCASSPPPSASPATASSPRCA